MFGKPVESDLPPVAVTYHAASEHWQLLRDYSAFDPRRNAILTAMAGFTFDLSSVPRPLWFATAPFELSIVAPLFHDLLYRYGGKSGRYLQLTPEIRYTRSQADDLFKDQMEDEGVGWFRRHSAYRAVRWFGGSSWRDG